jgi:hypothetical protein
MFFHPKVGEYSSEMWHAAMVRQHPLTTYTSLTVGGVDYSLGGYVRYRVGKDVHVGRIISTFVQEEENETVQGLTTSTGRTCKDVLAAARDTEPPVSCFVRRYASLPAGNEKAPQTAGGGRDLLAMWGQEDKLILGAGIMEAVTVCGSLEELTATLAVVGLPNRHRPRASMACTYASGRTSTPA